MPVLICYDGSTSAQRALSVAASALDGAPMVLLNIWNPPQRVLADSFGLSESEHGPTYAGARGPLLPARGGDPRRGRGRGPARDFQVTTRQEPNRSSIWKTILACCRRGRRVAHRRRYPWHYGGGVRPAGQRLQRARPSRPSPRAARAHPGRDGRLAASTGRRRERSEVDPCPPDCAAATART